MSIIDISEHRDMRINCAVCKSKEPGPTMLLVPHTTPNAIVLIHVKCMGGLPMIALKWKITSYTGKQQLAEEQPTVLEFLRAWPSELLDFDGKERG